jgi:hypothetical protein
MHFHHYHYYTQIDWVAVISAIAALIAASVAGYQAWLLRFSNNANLILKFDEQFNSDSFIKTRAKAAKAIKAIDRENKDDIEDVLDFFETVGLMVRRKGLDKEMVWHTFFYWIHGYCNNTEDLIASQRKLYPNRYCDIIELHSEMLCIEQSNHGPINESEWSGFLEEEQRLE